MRAPRLLIAGATAASLLLAGAPAGADNTVGFDQVTVSGSSATVKDTAQFPAITTPESVVGEEVGQVGGQFAAQQVSDAAGVNLTDGKIVPISGGLRFIWVVNSMPPQVPPEGVRYNWALMIGNNTYQLQAKRTSIASVNFIEDPKGHIDQAAAQKNFFQLRGACRSDYIVVGPQQVNGCYHFAFLNGTFDIANKQVTMDWPFETKDAIGRIVAPDFKPGVTLTYCGPPYATAVCDKSAGMSITGSFQAVVSNTQVSNFINDWSPYYVGGRVQLGVGNHTSDPASITYDAPVALNGGAFQTTVSGLSSSTNTIFARACNGRTCAYSSYRAII